MKLEEASAGSSPWFGAAVWGMGLYFLAAFLFLVWRHIPYPFELEWMEGGMLDHVQRLLQGKQIYGPPSLEFTAFSYAPLYFYFAAALGKLFGASLALLRAISAAATLTAVALIGIWVRQETGSRRLGMLAGALYLATYPVSGSWFDLARVDSLYLLLLLGGFYLLRRGRGQTAAFLAAMLLALALFCKQTALIVTLPMLFYALCCMPSPRKWIFLAIYLLLIAGGFWVMEAATSGWFSYYLLYLPSQHLPVWWRVHHFWIDYLIKPLPIALSLGVAFLIFAAKSPRKEGAFWLFSLAGLIGGPWLASVPSGAFHNVAMPAHAGVAILFALAIGQWLAAMGKSETVGGWRLLPWSLAVVQLTLLFYNPLKLLPSAADRRAGEELVQRLTAAPGPVWIPSHGYLAERAGKSGCAHRCALEDVLRGKDEPGKRGIVRELNEAISSGRYAVMVVNDGWLADELKSGYGAARAIFTDAAFFYPVTGWQTRPEWWYARAASGL